MYCGNKKRFAVIFCFKAGLSATETPVSVQKACGNETVNRSKVVGIVFTISRRKGLVEDDERGGRPKSTRTEINIVAVADLVKNDSRIASRIIAESFKIPKTVVLRILKGDFCSRHFFLLHDNAPVHKAASVCQFFTLKNVTTIYQPPYSTIYLHQTIFCFPS
jgi:hypothetical protein